MALFQPNVQKLLEREDVERLARAAKHKDQDVRKRAIEALALLASRDRQPMGGAAVKALLACDDDTARSLVPAMTRKILRQGRDGDAGACLRALAATNAEGADAAFLEAAQPHQADEVWHLGVDHLIKIATPAGSEEALTGLVNAFQGRVSTTDERDRVQAVGRLIARWTDRRRGLTRLADLVPHLDSATVNRPRPSRYGQRTPVDLGWLLATEVFAVSLIAAGFASLAQEVLLQALAQEDPKQREGALWGLIAVSGEDAGVHLLPVVEGDSSKEVREAALRAVVELTWDPPHSGAGAARVFAARQDWRQCALCGESAIPFVIPHVADILRRIDDLDPRTIPSSGRERREVDRERAENTDSLLDLLDALGTAHEASEEPALLVVDHVRSRLPNLERDLEALHRTVDPQRQERREWNLEQKGDWYWEEEIPYEGRLVALERHIGSLERLDAAASRVRSLSRPAERGLEKLNLAPPPPTEPPQDNVAVALQKGREAALSGKVTEAVAAFNSVLKSKVAVSSIEPEAHLLPVFERLQDYDGAAQCLSRIREAGLGLDPAHEREWRAKVNSTSPEDLRSALMS